MRRIRIDPQPPQLPEVRQRFLFRRDRNHVFSNDPHALQRLALSAQVFLRAQDPPVVRGRSSGFGNSVVHPQQDRESIVPGRYRRSVRIQQIVVKNERIGPVPARVLRGDSVLHDAPVVKKPVRPDVIFHRRIAFQQLLHVQVAGRPAEHICKKPSAHLRRIPNPYPVPRSIRQII